MITSIYCPRWSLPLALWLTVPLTAFVAVACGGDDKPDEESAGEPRSNASEPIIVAADAPIVIGASLPVTGPDSSAGREDRAAIATAFERWREANGDQISGHDIEIRVEDDGCTEADVTALAAEQLLRQPGLVGVIGPNCSAGAAAAIPIYAGAGIVAISGSATSSDLTENQRPGGYFFRTVYRNDLEGLLIALATAGDIGNMLVVDDGEAYGQDLADSASRLLEENGVSVERETIERGAVDYSDLAADIAGRNPDFVGFAGFNPEAALFYRQLRDAGYDGPFGAGDAAASVSDFVEPVGAEAAEGVVFAGCALTLPEDFLSDFENIHGVRPSASAFVAQYADAVTVLLGAIAETAESQDDGSLSIDPAALRDAVAASHLSDGLSGSVAFDANGDRVSAPGDNLEQLVSEAAEARNVAVFPQLGLVPCQVRDGRLVNVTAG
jgi:branched-chain amino acid transport system substrate-binding protein